MTSEPKNGDDPALEKLYGIRRIMELDVEV